MKFIGNAIWFLFGGLFMALGWWIAGVLMYVMVITIPWGNSCFRIGLLCLSPFGKDIVSDNNNRLPTNILSLIGNIIWIVFSGVWLAIGHFVWGVLLCVTILGFPFGMQHFKLARACIAPVGKKIITK